MKGKYGRVTPRIIEELTAVAGKNCVLTDQQELEGYRCDETPLATPHTPQVVVKPSDKQTIAKVLSLAKREKIPVTPRGAGTGLSGGCIPIYGGLLLSMERMNRILEIDGGNLVAVVEAGVTLSDLSEQLESQGFYYPIYPGEMTATIGGTIATNAGGLNAVKYGVTRHNVLGLEAVLPSGRIIRTGGKFVKCSTGYDLTQVIIGSEGTLAVVTEVILKVTTRPAIKEVLFAPFTNIQGAIDTVPEILRLKMTPTGIEFMERDIIEIVEKYLDREIPHHEYAAFLMITAEGESEDTVYEYFSQVEEICKRHGATEARVPPSARARRELLKARENFYHAVKRHAPLEVIDVVVPRNSIADFVKRVKEIAIEHRVPVIMYGHAGDGNVHLHPICLNMNVKEWSKRLPGLMSAIYSAGVSLGGAISGEHGIGLAKKAHFQTEYDKGLLELTKNIKQAFDPDDILNPGKIFDL